MRLSLTEHPEAAEATGPNRVVHELDDGRALVWALGDEAPAGALLSAPVALDDATEWLMRCDRVDFEPGGVAPRHRHRGGGIRCLLRGRLEVTVADGAPHVVRPGECWFESGREPVLATTAADEPSAFVRVMLLPVEWAGQRTIKYVDPADADKPKTQRATIFLEQPVRR